MSKYFVSDEPIPVREWDDPHRVSDQLPNVIWVRSKMDVKTKGAVTSEMFAMTKENTMEARLGQNETALLVHNIVKWGGPDLDAIPCTRANIEKLDPTEPHIARVLEVIAERNKSPKAPPASSTSGTSSSAGATDSSTPTAAIESRSAHGRRMSRLPIVSAGDPET